MKGIVTASQAGGMLCLLVSGSADILLCGLCTRNTYVETRRDSPFPEPGIYIKVVYRIVTRGGVNDNVTKPPRPYVAALHCSFVVFIYFSNGALP